MTKDELERMKLAQDRLREIRIACDQGEGETLPEAFMDYFFEVTNLVVATFPILKRTHQGTTKDLTFPDFVDEQAKMYRMMQKDQYATSFLNPAFAVEQLGKTLGQILSAIYMDLMALVPWSYEGAEEKILVYLELLIEVHAICEEAGENIREDEEYVAKEIIASLKSFQQDYTEIFVADGVRSLILPEESKFYLDIVMNSDLEEPRFLYYYGAPIGSNELGLWEYMSKLPERDVRAMAKTLVDGYVEGFRASNRDISIKEVASLEYPIGMERMVRYVVKMLEIEGLKVTIRRDGVLSSQRRNAKRGVYNDAIDPQVYYDHRDDRALYLDANYIRRSIEVTKATYDKYKKEAPLYGGPVVIETFGEKKFDPVNKKESVSYTSEQHELIVELMSETGRITNEAIHGDERSFTIISYPYPSIGENFKEIFSETVAVNTLDSNKFRTIQQHLIDALDQGTSAHILGRGENRTDLTVALHPLSNPEKETIFENCVADVNIPVGEVFTSPQLEGTNGVLHVSRVYLNGFEYRDLEITFKEGMIEKIMCGNFETEEENLRYIDDHILFHHKTLPLGEFAIGTNTTAYRMAKKFDIEDRMPILIAEKTGPHFAVGDTCYSEAEDVAVFNPDGKEIIPRDNSITAKYRKTDPAKAYFNCHTDVTIPYEELGSIAVVHADGTETLLIDGGRFVLPGTEELNIPLDEMEKENAD